MNKALIIKKKWLDKILSGEKTWEMRSRRTRYRGKIGLIESGSGLIVGEARLVSCSPFPIKPNLDHIDKHQIEDIELLKKWCYAWELAEIKKYNEPTPYIHPRGAVVWVNL